MTMAAAVGLNIPVAYVENVRLWLSTPLTEMEQIEQELGGERAKTEPVPPAYPREEF